MKQLVMLTAAGLMALVLSACGEGKPKQPADNQTTTTVQPQKADDATAAKPADAGTTTTTTQPQE